MANSFIRSIEKKPLIFGIVVFLSVLVITQLITYQKYLLNVAEHKGSSNKYLEYVSEKVEKNLTDALNTTKTLAFLVENYGEPRSFDSLAQKLIEGKSCIHAIQILKNGIITSNYPEHKTESVIGYNVMADSMRNKELLKAFQEEGFYFGGPFELRQGGLGIVGRVPIKNAYDSLNLAAVVIKMESLLEAINIDQDTSPYYYDFSKVNPNTGVEEFFINKEELFNSSDVAKLYLPQGDWKIYIKLKHKTIFNDLWRIGFLGFLFALTSGILAWFVAKQPNSLRLKVAEQTKLITETKNKFENLVEYSFGAAIITNEKGIISYASSSIKNITGYNESELVDSSFLDLIHPEDNDSYLEQLDKVAQKPHTSVENLFFRIQHKNNSWRWFESNINNLKDIPSTNGYVINFKDVTDKKLADELIIKEKALLNTVINSLPGIFYLFNNDGKFLLWNKNFEEVSGYSEHEISQMHPLDFFDEPEQPYLESRIEETFEKGISFAETYFYTKQQEKIYFYFTGVTIKYQGMDCLLGTGIDFSERKKAIDELVKSEQEMLSIFNNAIDAVIVMDKDGYIRNWNPKAEFIFGWSSKDAIGKKLSTLIIPEQHKQAHEQGMQHYKNTGEKTMINRSVEITAMNRKGDEFEVSLGVSNAHFSGREYFIGFISDISQRKINERLKEFERKDKEALINSTQDLMWSVNQEFKLLAANEAFLKTTKKYSNIGLKIGDYVLENNDLTNQKYIQLWKHLYERGLKGENFTHEVTIPANNVQDERIIETHFNPIIINKKVEGVACYSRDITERRRFKTQLIDINKKLTTAQEIGKIGYWEIDLITEELFWSDEVFVIWEVDKHQFELNMQTYKGSIHREDIEDFHKAMHASLNQFVPLDFEHRINLPSGDIKWVHGRGQIILNENKQPITFEGTVQDINKEKLAQIELEEQNNFIKSAIENLPIGIAVNKISDGQSTLMNKTFTDIYGWTREDIDDVETFFEKVYPDAAYRAKIKSQVLSDMASGDPERMNWESVEITTKKGEKRIINAKNIPLLEQDLMISSVLDVTEKALAEQKLRLSNERFEYVLKATYDAVWDWDLLKNEVFWGDGIKTTFGHKKIGNKPEDWTTKIHPDDLERVMSSIYTTLNDKRLKNWSEDYRLLKADKSYAYVKDKGIVIRNIDRNPVRMIGSMRDISLQKEYELQILESNLRLKNLAEHLQNAREEERIYVAREIHDELGQRLTGIKLDASWIKNKIQSIYPEGGERIERLIEGVNSTISKVRKLATDLRPGVLDDLGLEAAIEWHLEQFKQQTNIEVMFQSEALRNNYNKTINTAVYRIFQEALTNITRHAKATKIKVFLFEENNVLNLHIADNGKGVSDSKKENTLSLGLTGMRERAEMLGGEFSINKQINGGTIVKVSIPLE